MKTIYIFILFFAIISFDLLSQTFPKTISYQAVARNEDGTAVENKEITIEVSITQGTDCDQNQACNVIWQELHFPTTNELGLFNVNIGAGQNTFVGSSTSYDNINWTDFTNGNYFLKIRVDFGNSTYGNGLIDIGTVKMQSVPYTITAQKAQDIERQAGKLPFSISDLQNVNISSPTNSQVLSWNGTQWINSDPNATGVTNLSSLSDVNLTSISDGQFLYYLNNEWINTNLIINNISNVNTSSEQIGDILTWNGTQWTNQTSSSVWLQDANYVYYNAVKFMGIGTATPLSYVNVFLSGNNGFVVNGAYSNGSITDLGAGTYMFFYPSKAAFRAGSVASTQWSNANTGIYSAAFGQDNTAIGTHSVAAGKTNLSSGNFSASFGSNNQAIGIGSLVSGTANKAVGLYSLVCGSNNNLGASLDGDYSIVAGNLNNGYSESSLTIGTSTSNRGNNSIVFGATTRVDGMNSIAGGDGNFASGKNSIAFGEGNTAQSYASITLGRYNFIEGNQLLWVATDPILVVGNGTSNSDRQNSVKLTKDGNLLLDGTTSSPALKNKNYEKINFDIDNIMSIQIGFENKKGTIYYGIDAKSIETNFPSLIVDFNNEKNIKYEQFIPILIQTIQIQQNTIEELQKQNQELLKRIENIEQKIK